MLHGKRNQKVALEIKQVVAEALLLKARDPRLGFVTVTDVDLSPDLKNAKVYVSVWGEEKEKESTLISLNHAKSFYQKEMASRLNLRRTPKIHFALDRSIDQGVKIDGILNQIASEETEPDQDGEA